MKSKTNPVGKSQVQSNPMLSVSKIHSVLLLFFLVLSVETEAQTQPGKTAFFAASAGLARSEDGLQFLQKNSASQWTPMLNIGIGYRFNTFIGLETHAATMLTDLKAEGKLVSTNENAKVSARHSNVVISPVFYLPIRPNSEIYLRTGIGLLFSESEITSTSNPVFKKSTSNIGYMITLGYARKLNNRVVLTVQFDFSDPYGGADVWSGDAGLLNAGIRYTLNHSK